MVSVQLTVEQILDAAQQLPDKDRVYLISQLVGMPKGPQARAALEQLRGQFQMEPHRQQRMSLLLEKSHEHELAPAERAELDELVDEFQQRSLELAQAVARSVRPSPTRARKG